MTAFTVEGLKEKLATVTFHVVANVVVIEKQMDKSVKKNFITMMLFGGINQGGIDFPNAKQSRGVALTSLFI